MSIEHPLAYHVTMRLADDRVLAPSDLERRRAARVLLRIGRDFDLLAFRLADTHLHALVRCSAEASGRFCQRVACALLEGGRLDRARRALEWLASVQQPDGRWDGSDHLAAIYPPSTFYRHAAAGTYYPLWALALARKHLSDPAPSTPLAPVP